MKAGWSIVPLGEVIEPVERLETPIPGKPYRQVGVRLWGEGAYQREEIDGADTNYKTLNQVAKDDIIVNKIWARNGSVSVISEDLEGSYCSPEFPLFLPDKGELLPRWFFWITKTRWFWGACDQKSRGTSGKNRIKPSQFLEVEIPLPPLKEQHRIVARIDALAARIEEARRLREEIERDAQAMLRAAFQRVIEGAAYRPMAEVAPIVRRKVEIEPDGEYPELGVRSFHKGTFFKCVSGGADIAHKKMYHIEPGDLIFSNIMAWEGAIAVARPEDEGRIGVHRFITCVPLKEVATSDFLGFYFQTGEGFQKIVEASPATIARNRTLSIKKLEKIEVPVPPLDKQRWFNGLQQQVAQIRQARAASQPALDALLPAILDQAFMGEL